VLAVKGINRGFDFQETRMLHQPNAQITQPPTFTLVGTPKKYGFFKILSKLSEYGEIPLQV
jgi:hypothetical protein